MTNIRVVQTTHYKEFFVLLQLYQEQIQMLLDAFKNPPQTREEGLYFEDKQYKCVRADKNSIYAKQVCVKCCVA